MKALPRIRGFTLIDVLVGTALLLIVFSGIFGAYRLGLQTLTQSQHRVVATATANEFLEMAHNLPYGEVGVQGGYPEGFFPASQLVTRNGADYTLSIDISYVADDSDGLVAPDDACINDYKRMLVTASWQGRFPGEVYGAGDIAPQNQIQECEDAGGLLRLQIFDALGIPVSNASITVEDTTTSLTDVCATDAQGVCQLLLPVFPPGGENYKIQVAKTGYSSTETFVSGDVYNGNTIATPENPHATILEGEITGMSFAIDQVSSFEVETRSSRGRKEFLDPFDDTSLLVDLQDTEVENGNLRLSDDAGPFPPSGTATSSTITDTIVQWGQVSWNRALPPQTSFTVQVLFQEDSNWILIPELDLPGNAAGFADSPVDLSSVNVVVYPTLRLQANLFTTDPAATSSLDQWQLSYFAQQDFPLGSIPFHLQSTKLVGTDAVEQPIYKYDADHSSDASGRVTISDMEWDNYSFSVDQAATGFTIAEIVPAPQPISLSPAISQQTVLYLAAENSLLVTVQDAGSSIPIFSASVQLQATGFDETQLIDTNGQTLFIPLDATLYTIDVTAQGYEDFSDTITVVGNISTLIELQLNPE